MTVQEAAALVDQAADADTAAIDALEQVITGLRLAQRARAEIVARVPTELIRQVLIDRSAGPDPSLRSTQATP